MLQIRFATPDDAATIHGFIQALAEYEREPDAVEVSPEQLRAQLADARPPFECLIAEQPEVGPVGFALFFSSYSTWRGRAGLYLEDLFVLPPRRGQGVGRALLARLAALAHARGHARLEWAVLRWNAPALRFYDQLGARPMAEWITYRLTDGALTALAAEDRLPLGARPRATTGRRTPGADAPPPPGAAPAPSPATPADPDALLCRLLVPPAAARAGRCRVWLHGARGQGPCPALVPLELTVSGLDEEGAERLTDELRELLDPPLQLTRLETYSPEQRHSLLEQAELLFDGTE